MPRTQDVSKFASNLKEPCNRILVARHDGEMSESEPVIDDHWSQHTQKQVSMTYLTDHTVTRGLCPDGRNRIVSRLRGVRVTNA